MPWPSWLGGPSSSSSSNNINDLGDIKVRSWNDSLNATDWAHYTSPENITLSVLTTGATLLLYRLYRIHLMRIPNANFLTPNRIGKRSMYGYVTSVGDADNFRLFHTPGGRLAGWGWLPGRQFEKMKSFQNKTVHVRIAGVDAPEAAHFGRPAQPYSKEALEWLRGYVLHKYVRVMPYRRDQYERVVCTVHRWRWGFWKTDVGLQMLKSGCATVYEAKFGSEFGGAEKEKLYRETEAVAKVRQVGMWQKQGLVGRMLGGKKAPSFESPRAYKTRMAKEEKAK
jgi:endonuclease YncB( thermonuclease family)